jgi:hypothetical protein
MTDASNTINKIIKVNFKGVPWLLIFSMLLVTLKAFGKFPFDWIWTIAPLWMPIAGTILVILAVLALGVIAFVGALTFYSITAAWTNLQQWNRRRKAKKSEVR